MDSNKKDVSSDELLAQLNKLKQELSGLREENDQEKSNLSVSEESQTVSATDSEEIINLDDILKKIEKMKEDNSDFMSPEPKSITPVEHKINDFEIDESLSRLSDLADNKAFSSENEVNTLDVIRSTELDSSNISVAQVENFGSDPVSVEKEEVDIDVPVENISLELNETQKDDSFLETNEAISTERIVPELDGINDEKSIEEKKPAASQVSIEEMLAAVNVVSSKENEEIEEPADRITLLFDEMQSVDSKEVSDTKASEERFALNLDEVKTKDSIEEVNVEASTSGFTQTIDEVKTKDSIEEVNVGAFTGGFTQTIDEEIEVVRSPDLFGNEELEDLTKELDAILGGVQNSSLSDSVSKNTDISIDALLSDIDVESNNLDSKDGIIGNKTEGFGDLEEVFEEKKSEILDINFESTVDQNDKLSLAMILADTQELNTLMIESEIELEMQRRAAAKNFDPKNSDFDVDGNITNPKRNTKKYLYIAIAAVMIVFVLLVDTSILKMLTDREDPKIEFTSETVYVEVGQEYNLADGVTVSDNKASEEYLKDNLVIESQPEFKTDTVGTYVVSYSVKDEGRNKTNATQTIYVVPEGYELVLTVPTEDLVVQVGAEVNLMDGVSVSNGLDSPEELLSKVKISMNPDTFNTDEPGTYEATYSITDSTGNVAVANRTIIVEASGSEPVEETEEEPEEEAQADTTPPVVSITSPDVTIAVGESYDPTDGVYASDDVSSVDYIWSNMEMSSSPAYDPNQPGTYYITFTFTDEAGNSTTAERVIRVK